MIKIFTFLLVSSMLILSYTANSQTTINFDNAANWSINTGALNSYGDHSYTEGGISFQGTNVLRSTTALQDGYASANGTFAFQLRNAHGSKLRIEIPSGGLHDFSFKVRRWDSASFAATDVYTNKFKVRYSLDGGSYWTDIASISKNTFSNSDFTDYYSQVVNNTATNILIEIVNLHIDARIMVDDFTFTSHIACSGEPTAQAWGITVVYTTSTSAELGWRAGTGGDAYLLVVNEGAAVSWTPTDGVDYSSGSGSGNYSNATDLGLGNKVVFTGSLNNTEVTGLKPNTYYFFKLYHYCTNAPFDYLDTTRFGSTAKTKTPQPTYCDPGTWYAFNSNIASINLVGVYKDISYTSNTCHNKVIGLNSSQVSVDMRPDSTYYMSVVYGDCDGGTLYNSAGGVWIDWNQDGDFSDAGETIDKSDLLTSGGDVTKNYSIHVPSTQNYGLVKMRIMQDQGETAANLDPCANPGNGSIIDFNIEIINHNDVDPPTIFTANESGPYNIYLVLSSNSSGDSMLIVTDSLENYGWHVDGVSNSLGTPVDGVTYEVGDQVPGGGVVLYKGLSSTVYHNYLLAGTSYYYKAWSFNSNHQYSKGSTQSATTNYPQILLNPSTGGQTDISISGMDYHINQGPSALKSFEISGAGLNGDVIISGGSDFEMTLDTTTSYSGTITIPGPGGYWGFSPKVVYVRLKDNLNAGSYHETFRVGTNSLPFDMEPTIQCSGSVIAPDSMGSLLALAVSPTRINLSAIANSDGDDIIVAYDNTGTMNKPANGVNYTPGSSISGGGMVYYVGAAGSLPDHTGLNEGTTYYYKAWSKEGLSYSDNAVSASATTTISEPASHVSGFSSAGATDESASLTWGAGSKSANPDGYLVKGSSISFAAISAPIDSIPEEDSLSILVLNVPFGSDTATFTGLDPNTTYFFKIWPYTNSDTNINYKTDGNIPETHVTTLARIATPVALAASAISSSGFQANWGAMNGASGYQLDVFQTPERTESEGFNDGTNAPPDWVFSGISGTYTSSGNYGNLSPSLKMDNSSDRITTPLYDSEISELSFWIKGQGTDASSALLVEGYDGNSWSSIDNITGIPTSGRTYSYSRFTSVPLASDIKQIRFTYTKSQGDLSLDDVELTIEPEMLSGYNGKSLNQTNDALSSLNSASTYYYRVRGEDGGFSTPNSNVITVHTLPVAASNLDMIPGTNSITLSWTRGDGDGVLVKLSDQKFTYASQPDDGADYTSQISTNYSGSGEQWIYDGTGTSVVVTLPNGYDVTLLNLAVFEYFVFDDGSKAPQKIYDDGKVKGFGGDEGNLPINLLSFSAQQQNSGVELQWVTNAEINNDYFTVERAQDGVHFSEVGRVAGAGNSNVELHYSLMDMEGFQNTIYYRLRQTDYDGTSTLSKVIELNAQSQHQEITNLYVNNKTLHMQVKSNQAIASSIEVYAVDGRLVHSEALTLSKGVGSYQIDLPKSLSGVYLVNLRNSQGLITKRVLVK